MKKKWKPTKQYKMKKKFTIADIGREATFTAYIGHRDTWSYGEYAGREPDIIHLDHAQTGILAGMRIAYLRDKSGQVRSQHVALVATSPFYSRRVPLEYLTVTDMIEQDNGHHRLKCWRCGKEANIVSDNLEGIISEVLTNQVLADWQIRASNHGLIIVCPNCDEKYKTNM